MDDKVIIGRREYVSFPELGLKNIEAKVDTGAYTSSIHCDAIEIDGSTVRCIFLDPSHPDYTGERFEFNVQKEIVVRSSNGMEEQRAMIETNMELFGKRYRIKLTLTDRSNMNYPILLGRKFLTKHAFLVDVTRKHQS